MRQNPGFLMVYSLGFLGSGPHFDELAHYFSFEEIIHLGFDGIYSFKGTEQRDQWLEVIESSVDSHVRGDLDKPVEVDIDAIVRFVQNQFILYVEWLTNYVMFPNESCFSCVETVWFDKDDVYIRAYDYDKE